MPFLLPIWLSTHLKWSTQSSWQLFTVQIVLRVVVHPELRWGCLYENLPWQRDLPPVSPPSPPFSPTYSPTHFSPPLISKEWDASIIVNIRKIARYNNQQNWTGWTDILSTKAWFRQACSSAMEMWNIWWLVEFNFNSLFEITSLLIVV